MSNGLNDLSNRRKRRQPPPPKHPRSEQQDEPIGAEPAPEAAAKSAPEPKEPQTAPQPSAPERGRSDATRAKRTPSVEAYLDQELLDWLWEVQKAAVERRERSVVSPTIRLALQELKKRMSAEQVVEELLSRPPKGAGRPGRPRR